MFSKILLAGGANAGKVYQQGDSFAASSPFDSQDGQVYGLDSNGENIVVSSTANSIGSVSYLQVLDVNADNVINSWYYNPSISNYSPKASVAIDNEGKVYASVQYGVGGSINTSNITKYDPSTNSVDWSYDYTSGAGGRTEPRYIVYDENEDCLWATCQDFHTANNPGILKIDASNGNVILYCAIITGNTYIATGYPFIQGSYVYFAFNLSGGGSYAYRVPRNATTAASNWRSFSLNDGGFAMPSADVVGADISDNVYIITRNPSPPYPCEIAKFNSSGVVQWQKRLYVSNDNAFLSVDPKNGDCYLIRDGSQKQLYVLDSSGNVNYAKLIYWLSPSGGSGIRHAIYDRRNEIFRVAYGGFRSSPAGYRGELWALDSGNYSGSLSNRGTMVVTALIFTPSTATFAASTSTSNSFSNIAINKTPRTMSFNPFPPYYPFSNPPDKYWG